MKDKNQRIATAAAAKVNLNSTTTKTVKEWIITSPDGVVHNFKNLRLWLRDNADLFNPDDILERVKKNGVKWSRAEAGLTHAIKTVRGSWKGWAVRRPDMPPPRGVKDKHCVICNELFTPHANSDMFIFCSKTCRRKMEKLKYSKLKEPKKCAHCGEPFETEISHRVFCSANCRARCYTLSNQNQKDLHHLKKLK